MLGEIYFWPSPLLTPLNLSSRGGRFPRLGPPSVMASTFSSKPSPTQQRASGTDLPKSPLLFALPGPYWHTWAPHQGQRCPSPSQDSCGPGQGSGLGARLRNVGVSYIHTPSASAPAVIASFSPLAPSPNPASRCPQEDGPPALTLWP